MQLDCQKHILSNGLEVLLYPDASASVVAVYLYYHVGSSREEAGRSGFAHLFEHMLFQGSEHVGDNDHFRLIQAAGGTLNGTTNQDRTNYFETLPANQLELALWLESDRMGFLLPAMTQAKLDNQRAVVMNERRQSYENRPYGLVYETILAALYPSGHPYHWPTIGSMEDIERATLEDVERFFRRWYGPNNATLAIGGDFEPQHALALVERYFGGLPRGPMVSRPGPEPAVLPETVYPVLEDRVGQPQLTLVWPTVPSWHVDEAPLNLLMDVLSANKSSVLDKALMIDAPLASMVTIAHSAAERAGSLMLHVRPHAGHSLDEMLQHVDRELAKLLATGIDPERLERLKARREGATLRSLETLAARTNLLAHYNCFRGDPQQLQRDLDRHRAVTSADVQRVLELYLGNVPRVVLSVVPAGQRELAIQPLQTATSQPPRSEPDRTAPPAPGADRAFQAPNLWRSQVRSMPAAGTPFHALPLDRYRLSFPTGRHLEADSTRGLATLAAALWGEGTQRLTSTELTDELDGLGAEIDFHADHEELSVECVALREHRARACALFEEVVLQPRLAQDDFERLRRERLVHLETRADRPREVADGVFLRRVHDGHSLGAPRLGTPTTIAALTLEDVASHVHGQALLSEARFDHVGSLGPDEIASAFPELSARSVSKTTPTELDATPPVDTSRGVQLYLVDKPGAPQSELRVGHLGVPRRHPDFFGLQVLNYILGGGFSSRINLNLREDKGYTYGASSAFRGGRRSGEFLVSTAVKTSDTAASLVEIQRELVGMADGVTHEELHFAQEALGRALTRGFESSAARMGFLTAITRYGEPEDYLERRRTWLAAATREELARLTAEHLRPAELAVVIVGDAAQVRPALEGLDWGPVQTLDVLGEVLDT